MLKLQHKRIRITLIIIFVFIILSNCVYAKNGDGDGGGGGPGVPLKLNWSFPADGETYISVSPIIQCKFSHNVAHYDVKDRNATLFSLALEDGSPVPIDIYIVDAQIEFDKRQYIYASPVEPLKMNTKYIMTIKEGVQAKNGMVTEEDYTFKFTTGKKTVPLKKTSILKNIQEENVNKIVENQEVVSESQTDIKKTYENSDKSNEQEVTSKEDLNTLVKKDFPMYIVWLAIFSIIVFSSILNVVIRKRK